VNKPHHSDMQFLGSLNQPKLGAYVTRKRAGSGAGSV